MSGAFWRFGNDYQIASAINKLLDDISDEAKELDYQPTVEAQDEILSLPIAEAETDKDIKVLDQLLDHQDILQELLSSNTKLIDFLKNFKILARLVDYVILDYNEYNKLKEKQIKKQQKTSTNNSQVTKSASNDTNKAKEEEDKEEKEEGVDDDATETIKEDPKDKQEIDSTSSSSLSSSPDSEDNTSTDEPAARSDSSWDDGNQSVSSSFYNEHSYYMQDTNEEDDDDEDGPQEVYSRRSQVAAEILSSDIWSITDAFINSPRLLIKLWSILDFKSPLSMMKATFFAKINEHLLDMKLDELVSYIIHFERNLTNRFFKHISNPQLMDFLLKLISTDKSNSSTGIILLLKKQKFIPKLINFLKPKYDNAIQTSAGDFLKAFITISGNSGSGQDGIGVTDSSIIGPNELTRQLVSKKMVKRLVKIMLCGGNSLSNGVGIVIEIIRKNNSDYDIFQVLFITLESHPPNLRDPIYLGNLLKIFARNIKRFKKMLLLGSCQQPLLNHQQNKVSTSFDKKIEPLGFERFKVCELIAELLHCSNMALLNEANGENIVKQRDAERAKVLKMEFEQLEESRSNYVEELKLNGDEELSEYIQTDHNPIAEMMNLEDSDNEEANIEDKAQEQEHEQDQEKENHEIVSNINRLSINDDLKDSDSIRSIRSEHNKNKRAKIDKIKSKNGVIQSESDESDSEVFSSDNDDLVLGDGNDTATDDDDDDDDDDDEDEEDEKKQQQQQQQQGNDDEADSVYEIDLSDQLPDDADEETATRIIKTEQFTFDFRGLISKDSYKNEFHVKNRQYYDSEERKIRDLYIIGDQLKIALQDSNIVIIIIDFFFKFPWNNFLHNVVYDIVQQILNGSVEIGFNKYLIINLFLRQKGFILEKILRGYKFSEKYERLNHGLRLGYMGHLTLISEEIVKFLSFTQLESLFWDDPSGNENTDNVNANNSSINNATHNNNRSLESEESNYVNDYDEWDNYVNNVLIDTREQFNSVLGGGSLTDDYDGVSDSNEYSKNEVSTYNHDDDDDDDDDEEDRDEHNQNDDDDDVEDDDDEDDDDDDDDDSNNHSNKNGNDVVYAENSHHNQKSGDEEEDMSFEEYNDGSAQHNNNNNNNNSNNQGLLRNDSDAFVESEYFDVKNQVEKEKKKKNNGADEEEEDDDKENNKIQEDINDNDNDRLDEDIDVSNSDKYKWHYLDKSDFGQSHNVDTTTANQPLCHGNNGNDDDNDEDFDDEYIDPNDDGNSYAHIKNIDMYSSILGGGAGHHELTSTGPKKKSKRAKLKSDEELTDFSSNGKKSKVGTADIDLNIVGEDNDAEFDDIDDDDFENYDENDEDHDDDDDDVDIDDDDDSYGLRRSTSKGDMNWNEDEQKRLLTMANFIHNNTGGSPVSAIANSSSNSNNANNVNEISGNKKQ